MCKKTWKYHHHKWFSIIIVASICIKTTSVEAQDVSMPLPGFPVALLALPSIPIGMENFVPTGTPVGIKTGEIKQKLQELQSEASSLVQTTRTLYEGMILDVNRYHKTVSDIESKLQLGTTPGNPQLLDLRERSFQQLNKVAYTIGMMNDLSQGFSNFLQQVLFISSQLNMTFSMPGAVDEDHAHLILMTNELAQLEGCIRRVLDTIVMNAQRQKGWLEAERVHFDTLSLAVDWGQFIVEGKSIPSSRSIKSSKIHSHPHPHSHKKHIKASSLKPSTEVKQSSSEAPLESPVSHEQKSSPSSSSVSSPESSPQDEEKSPSTQAKESLTYEEIAKGRAPLGILEVSQGVEQQKWYLISSAKRAAQSSHNVIDIIQVLDDTGSTKRGEDVKTLLEKQGFESKQLHLIPVKGNEDQAGKIYIFGE